MANELKIVRELTDTTKTHKAYVIFCPGCQCGHAFDSRWTFNGDMTKPTFSPSMLVNKDDPKSRCHSFVENGNIRFLDDCFHELKNKTVPLEPF